MKPRILIVDDMTTNLKLATSALEGEGYEFFTFSDPTLALEEIESIYPHIILLDIEMPKISGIDFYKKIKADEKFRFTPVIFVTTLDNETILKELFLLGAQDIVSKPFSPFQLKFRVKANLTTYFLTQKIFYYSKKMKDKSEENESLIKLLCHDLVNPLSIIKHYAGKLESEEIQRATEQCLEMVQHIREMMALESGKSDLKLSKVPMIEVLKRSIETMQIRFKEKNIQFLMPTGQSDQEVFICADKLILENQVLNNLLSNAAKFSPSNGQIFISYKKVGDHCHLTISDKGIGIPSSIFPHLFDRTKKTSRPGTNNEKGTGFGLPLVKVYMDRFEGDIEVSTKTQKECPDNHGTTFILIFKLFTDQEASVSIDI